MNNNDSFNGLEEEGLQYVVGYVASKFAKKYPLMVSEQPTTNYENWIRYLCRGGLTYPSSTLIKVANIMEKLFIDLHGNHLSKEEGIMKKLTNSLMEKIKLSTLDIPVEVVKCLVRTRTFIRLNNLNQIILNTKNIKKNKIKLKKFTG